MPLIAQEANSNLLVVSGFWPSIENPISGIFVVQQVAAFARAGLSVTVVVPKAFGRPTPERLSVADLGLNLDAVSLVEPTLLRLPEQLSSLPGALQFNTHVAGKMIDGFFRKNFYHRRFQYCLIHGERGAGLSFPWWSKRVDGRAVIVIHGADPYWNNLRNQESAHKLFKQLSEAVARVVIVGKPLTEHALRLGVSSDKLVVINNGTDLPESEHNSTIRVDSEAPVIASVSNLVPLKGIDDNIRALGMIHASRPDLKWEYWIIGDGSYRSDLERLVEHFDLAERVSFLGRLSYQDTMRKIAEADIFSMPSWGEAFGIVYLEAMARSKPVVGCLGNGAAEIVNHGENGCLVPPRAVEKLAGILKQLIEQPYLRKTLGENARQTAAEYSWDANVKKLLSVLRGVPDDI